MENSRKIENGGVKAEISQVGGTVLNFAIKNEAIFYPSFITDGEGKLRGGCPICAPWFDSSPRGLKKHGFLRNLKASDGGRRESAATFVFNHKANDNSHCDYPWDVQFKTLTSIQCNWLSMSLEMKRMTGDNPNPAPFLMGFHPYFSCQNAKDVSVNIGGRKYNGFSEELKVIPLSGKMVSINMPGRKIIMCLEWSFLLPDPCIVFWTDAPNKYVCVEPVFGNIGNFDTPKGLFLLNNETAEVSMIITAVSAP